MKIDLSIDPASLLPPGETLPLGNGRWKKPETKAEWEYLEVQMMNAVSSGGMKFEDGIKANLAELIGIAHHSKYEDVELRKVYFNQMCGILGEKGVKTADPSAIFKVFEGICRRRTGTIREMALDYQKLDLIENLVRDNLPLKKINMPLPLSIIGKAARVYAHVYANCKPPRPSPGRDIWSEQMLEQIENPERYGGVAEDENPLGIEIGDVVRVRQDIFGNYNAFVISVSACDDGDYSIGVQCPGCYGGGKSFTDVISHNGNPVSWSFTPKKKAPEFEAPKAEDIPGQMLLNFGGHSD